MTLLFDVGVDDILLKVCAILRVYSLLVEYIIGNQLRREGERVALCRCRDYR